MRGESNENFEQKHFRYRDKYTKRKNDKMEE